MKKAAGQRLFSWEQQWITVFSLQAFALRRGLLQELQPHRQALLRQAQQELRQQERLRVLQAQQQELQQRGQEQVLLLFCRKRSKQQQRPTGQRSTDSCS